MTNYKVKGCHFVVPVDVYHRDVLFTFGYNRQRTADLLTQVTGMDTTVLCHQIMSLPNNGRAYTAFDDDNGGLVVMVNRLPLTSEDYGTLAHEIFHVVEVIMDHIGNPWSNTNSESWAYLIGYITTQVYQKLNVYY